MNTLPKFPSSVLLQIYYGKVRGHAPSPITVSGKEYWLSWEVDSVIPTGAVVTRTCRFPIGLSEACAKDGGQGGILYRVSESLFFTGLFLSPFFQLERYALIRLWTPLCAYFSREIVTPVTEETYRTEVVFLLRREWPANDFIRNQYVEMIVAFEARDRLVAHLGDSSASVNVNLLLSFAAWALHSHDNVSFVLHRRDSTRILNKTTFMFTVRKECACSSASSRAGNGYRSLSAFVSSSTISVGLTIATFHTLDHPKT